MVGCVVGWFWLNGLASLWGGEGFGGGWVVGVGIGVCGVWRLGYGVGWGAFTA